MITGNTFDEALALARRLPLADRLRLASALAAEAAGVIAGPAPRPDPRAWPPAGVTIQLPTSPADPAPLLMGGAWDPDLPLRREDLYDERGRA